MNKNFLKLIVLAAVVAFASCKKEPGEQPGGDTNNCNIKGKFENVICGGGVYGSYWIRLDNGTLLQPCQSDAALLDMKDVYEGMPVELGYYGIKNSDCAESTILCYALPPEHETVKITCIKSLGKPRCIGDGSSACDKMGVLHDMRGKLDGCGWLIELNNGEMLDVGLQIDEKLFDDNTPVIVGYIEQNYYNSCMSGTQVKLTCIKNANTTTNK
jgi:hypothetical protein